MPDMDEGAFVLDYEMPVGTSLTHHGSAYYAVSKIACDIARTSAVTSVARAPSWVLCDRAVYWRYSRQPKAGR